MHFDNKKKGILDLGKGEAIVSYSFVTLLKIYQFKAKGSEIEPYSLCLDKISNDFTIDNMKTIGLKGVVKIFSVYYDATDTDNILGIHRYLMKKHDIK